MAITRDSACADVASLELRTLRPGGRIAVIDEPTGQVADALGSGGAEVLQWHTRAWDGLPARAELPAGAWDGAFLRLPRERARLALLLDLAAGRLAEGAPLWVVGANDEGIKSTAKRLAPLFDGAESVVARKHCRLLHGVRSAAPARGSLAAWQTPSPLDLPGVPEPVVATAVPGVFAGGALDPATALLLQATAELALVGPALDFACGIGVIALGVGAQHPDLGWTLTDVDALSLHCARLNLPDADARLGHGWAAVPTDRLYGAILSNPPLHRGVVADRTTVERLIDQAPTRLAKGGQLVVVSQRTAGVGTRMKAAFGTSRMLREHGGFQVWGATRP